MKKMKLAVMHGVGKELTRDELKNVFGGSTVKIGCSGMYEGEPCHYKNDHGQILDGHCTNVPVSGFQCWGG